MKKYLAVLSVMLLLAPAALAAPSARIALPNKSDTVVLPPGSGLKFDKFDSDGNVVFSGKLTLSGTFYYGDNAFNDGTTVDLTLYFHPDAATIARLPYLQTRGKAGEIVLTNGEAFAASVLTPAQRATLAKKSKTAPYATGTASVLVDGFDAGVVCDTASFTAHYLSLVKPATAKMGADPGAGC